MKAAPAILAADFPDACAGEPYRDTHIAPGGYTVGSHRRPSLHTLLTALSIYEYGWLPMKHEMLDDA